MTQDQHSEEFQLAYKSAMQSINHSDKSTFDIRQRLIQKKFSAEVSELVVQRLQAQGFLDDMRFAELLKERWFTFRGAGKRKLSFEFKKHGLSDEIEKSILNQITEDDELEKASEIAQEKAQQFNDENPYKSRKKLYDFLIRKGYDVQLSRKVAESLFKGNEEYF